MKFFGVREFKQDAMKYLNQENEIVVLKRKKPIWVYHISYDSHYK